MDRVGKDYINSFEKKWSTQNAARASSKWLTAMREGSGNLVV
jgi:hypothetical protein